MYTAKRPSVIARQRKDNIKTIAQAIVAIPALWILCVIYLSI